MNKNHQDKKLFFRIKKKDKNAFIEAYDSYADDIYRFAYFKIGSSEEAKDLTSAVFLKVWNYAQSNGLDESKSLRAFIYKTARHLIIDHYRQLREAETRLDDGQNSLTEMLADETQDLAHQAEVLSDMGLVKAGLEKLKDEYREMILLRFVDELSFGEIAEVTGKTSGSVRVQTFRALQALKDLLAGEKK
jgi:RNA polymerase sigma-70 factor, ECF subfamily